MQQGPTVISQYPRFSVATPARVQILVQQRLGARCAANRAQNRIASAKALGSGIAGIVFVATDKSLLHHNFPSVAFIVSARVDQSLYVDVWSHTLSLQYCSCLNSSADLFEMLRSVVNPHD